MPFLNPRRWYGEKMRLSDEVRLQRAQTFDKIAELYDQGRREPPDWLYRDLFAETLLPDSASVLEVGCGTGKSTLPLARRGCRVVALEMGANLTRLAERNLAAFQRVREPALHDLSALVRNRFRRRWRKRQPANADGLVAVLDFLKKRIETRRKYVFGSGERQNAARTQSGSSTLIGASTTQ